MDTAIQAGALLWIFNKRGTPSRYFREGGKTLVSDLPPSFQGLAQCPFSWW